MSDWKRLPLKLLEIRILDKRVTLDLPLILKLGKTGAAMASSIAYATAALTALFLYVRVTGIIWFAELLLPRGEDIDYGKSSYIHIMKLLTNRGSG